jgi:hypothetical protein
VRSDQVSFGRAPDNTGELQAMVKDDFSDAAHSADQVIAWLHQHKGYPHPIYLGCIHTWIYDTDHTYRVNVHTLVSRVHQATQHPILLYFEEENGSHSPHPVSTAHAASLRVLAESTSLLCATYASGQDSHSEVIAKVMHYKSWYGGTLGVPMTSLLIDVDTSQTPLDFYYGTRGDLANFDHVVGWALRSAFYHGFAGFHTYGNVGGKFGTKRAADSTYAALDSAWHDLAAANPKRKFSGM